MKPLTQAIRHKGELIEKETGKVFSPQFLERRHKELIELHRDTSRKGKPYIISAEKGDRILVGKRNTTLLTRREIDYYAYKPKGKGKQIYNKRLRLCLRLFFKRHNSDLYTASDISKVFSITRIKAYGLLDYLTKTDTPQDIHKLRITNDKSGNNAVFYTSNPMARDRNLGGGYLWFIRKISPLLWRK